MHKNINRYIYIKNKKQECSGQAVANADGKKPCLPKTEEPHKPEEEVCVLMCVCVSVCLSVSVSVSADRRCHRGVICVCDLRHKT